MLEIPEIVGNYSEIVVGDKFQLHELKAIRKFAHPKMTIGL